MRDPHAEWDASCCHRIDTLGVSPESPERFPVSLRKGVIVKTKSLLSSDFLEVGFQVRADALYDPLPL